MDRSLAHIEKITNIRNIPGADNIQVANVLGWTIIVRKGEFEENSKAVFFEIDSKLPETEWSEFMRTKHFKVKTMKLGKFGVISQGLALPISVFDVEIPNEENVDVTELLGVTYSVEEDNARKKTDHNAKYKSMASRHQKIFKQPWARWMMRREWGRKVMFLFFGRKKDKPLSFPTHFPFIHKTDEERCENMGWILENKEPWVKTQKIDGTSSTYILERKGKNKWEYYVCSRNVRQITPSQKNYHADIEGNVYWMMDEKYHIKDFLQKYIICV